MSVGLDAYNNFVRAVALDVAALLKQGNPLLDVSVEALPIPNRTMNILRRGDIDTVGQLAGRSADELRALPGFGTGCLQEVRLAMQHYNLTLRGD
jgi:DNA-directed RNA polymerase alpha subunit